MGLYNFPYHINYYINTWKQLKSEIEALKKQWHKESIDCVKLAKIWQQFDNWQFDIID